MGGPGDEPGEDHFFQNALRCEEHYARDRRSSTVGAKSPVHNGDDTTGGAMGWTGRLRRDLLRQVHRAHRNPQGHVPSANGREEGGGSGTSENSTPNTQ